MGLAGGPNITEDGLVFAYDTGNLVRSYRGEPTINYIAHQNAVPQSTYTAWSATDSGAWNTNHPNAIRAYSIDGGELTSYVNTGVGDWTNTHHAHWQYDSELGKPVTVMNCFDGNWKAKSFGAGMEAWSTYGMNAGDQYTISWLQWTNNLTKAAYTGFYSQNSSNTWNFYDGLSAPANTRTNTWERVSATFTISATRNLNNSAGNVYMYGHSVGSNSSPTVLKIADVQLELKNHATPYTGVTAGTGGRTTRSSTQGLLDITRNNSIDLSNVSFDSSAEKFFDGTNDHISGILPLQGNGAPHTVEIVMSLDINQSSVGVRRDPFTIGNAAIHQYSSLDINSSYMNWYFYGRDTTFTNSPLMVAGQYYHMVFSYAGGASNNVNKRVWYNGVEQTLSAGSSETSLLPNNPQFSIGRDIGRNTAYFPGKIPIFRVYNRALTPDEVQQNFQGVRNRFGI